MLWFAGFGAGWPIPHSAAPVMDGGRADAAFVFGCLPVTEATVSTERGKSREIGVLV